MQTAPKTPQRPGPRDVIADPAPFSNDPSQYQDAWFALKAAQGLPLDAQRAALVGPPRHHVAHPVPSPDPEPTAADIATRCIGRARALGLGKGFILKDGGAA